MDDHSFQIVDGFGDGIENPSVEQMRRYLDRLDIDDEEHGEVWLTHHQSSWTLSCFPSSKVVFYQESDDHEYKPRHITNVSRDKMLELWQNLADGRFDKIEKESWKPGHSSN